MMEKTALSCCKELSVYYFEWAFYCLNCFHSYRTKSRLEKHKNVCKDHDYCYVEMSKENNKILKRNHGEKSMKVSFLIYADLDSLLEKINSLHNDNTWKNK